LGLAVNLGDRIEKIYLFSLLCEDIPRITQICRSHKFVWFEASNHTRDKGPQITRVTHRQTPKLISHTKFNKKNHNLSEMLLPLSLNISIRWLLLVVFNHSSYSKNLWKYYLFCYDMFYHYTYFKYFIIIFTFSQIFWIRQMVKRAS
jgi:hypothetical protein